MPTVSRVRKQHGSAPEAGVSVELLTASSEIGPIETFRLRSRRTVARCLADLENCQQRREVRSRKLGVEDQQSLTRNTKCEFDTRPNNEALVRLEDPAPRSQLFRGGIPDDL